MPKTDMASGPAQAPAPAAEAGRPAPDELSALAAAALERQDWPAAGGYLEDLTRHYPDLLEPYLTLSDVLTLQGKLREAWEVLRAARHLYPEAFSLLKRLGLNCRRRGDLSGAMAAFSRLWSKNPQNLEILGHLSAVCMDLGLNQETKGYYQEAVRRNPWNIALWLGLAGVAQQLEDRDTFEQACRGAAALDAAHPRLLELAPDVAQKIDQFPPSPQEETLAGLFSSSERPLCSIIIPVFNHLPLTRQCLESIWENTGAPHEIMVVDNGSRNDTGEYLHRLEAEGWTRVINNRVNLGFARACNQGARAARGDHLVFLNNDTIVQPGWLEELSDCARQDARTGAVGAKLLYPDDTIQHAGVVFNRHKQVYHIYRHFDKDHPAANKEREFQAVTAACALIKKDLFFGAGGFDEGYRNGFEDVDLCFKLRQQGYRVVYNPRAVVYHLESKTPGRHDREEENSRLFRSRWLDLISGDDQKYYQEDGIVIEVLDRQENVTAILAHDRNDNFFWREAVKCRQEGNLDQAEACYLRALRFNPFDPRKVLVARELANLYGTLGKHSLAEKMHLLVATLSPPGGTGRGAAEVQESFTAP